VEPLRRAGLSAAAEILVTVGISSKSFPGLYTPYKKLSQIFCDVLSARFYRFFRRPNFTKFEHNTSIGEAMKTFGTEFSKCYQEGWFFQKNAKISRTL